MSYSAEENMKHRDVEQVIQQVFQISGVKLTADDPIVAVLVLQQRNQTSSFFQLQEETQKLLDAVTEIKKYREQIFVELMNEAKRTSKDTEERMIGILNFHLTEFSQSLPDTTKRNNLDRLLFCVIVIVTGSILYSLLLLITS